MSSEVVIVGGGVVGLEVARRLERSGSGLAVTLVDPTGLHVYQPLLPEVASGSLEPRHAVVPLRVAAPGARVLDGEAVALDEDRRSVEVCARDGSRQAVPYDHLVVAPGGVTRVMPIPGLVEHAVGFQTVAETLHLRDRVLERMQLAEATTDRDRRERALTFVFVGAGYSGVEAAAELHDMATSACRQFRGVRADELRFVLVEATDQILPMVQPRLRRAAVSVLEERGVDVRLSTMVESVVDRSVALSDGATVAADTLVWCAGARPSGTASNLGLPTDDDGAVLVDATLRVKGRTSIWAAGDAAVVPDLVRGGTCPGSAQYALRQGRRIAASIGAVNAGSEPKPFRYRQRGELITLGRGSAVGYVGPIPLTGRLAWSLRAGYHLVRFPTGRRVRVGIDWFVNAVFPREITSLGMVSDPERPLRDADDLAEESS